MDGRGAAQLAHAPRAGDEHGLIVGGVQLDLGHDASPAASLCPASTGPFAAGSDPGRLTRRVRPGGLSSTMAPAVTDPASTGPKRASYTRPSDSSSRATTRSAVRAPAAANCSHSSA